MSLPLSLIDTIIGTMLGGFIAGLIGFFVARYESEQIRRERHLHEHQANFRKIQKALVEAETKTWILSMIGAQGYSITVYLCKQLYTKYIKLYIIYVYICILGIQ